MTSPGYPFNLMSKGSMSVSQGQIGVMWRLPPRLKHLPEGTTVNVILQSYNIYRKISNICRTFFHWKASLQLWVRLIHRIWFLFTIPVVFLPYNSLCCKAVKPTYS